LIIATAIHAHSARLRSYELLARSRRAVGEDLRQRV
jgi:hypothetical protein